MGACKIVTIKKRIPLFKRDERANSIALYELDEVGNKVVAGIDTFDIKERVLFIEPDYCLPYNNVFKEYHEPGGDASKCRLGNGGRIRAIKFNLHIGDDIPVYSYGILMKLSDINVPLVEDTLDELLGITKYKPLNTKFDSANLGGSSKSFPEGMYKTDEENINNLWKTIKYPITLIGTQKIDGSSITIYHKDGKSGICSRNLEKALRYNKIVGRRKKTILEFLKQLFTGYKPNLSIYEEVEADNEFVTVGKPYLEKLNKYCVDNEISLALRGELNGRGLKGSGNPNNPSVKEEPNIKFYALDNYTLSTKRFGEEVFDLTLKDLGFNRCKKYFTKKMRCKADIINRCEKVFAQEEAKGNLIEGIVLKTEDGTFSTKYMNLKYDSKK